MLILAAVLAGLAAAPAYGGIAQTTAWCGTLGSTDRTPNVLAGHPVHAVYAIPADGGDRSAQFAPAMQADVEQIDAWWRGQDPTRTLRFDLFQFPCGAQLDLTLARLPLSGAELSVTETRFQAIAGALDRVGLLSDFVKTLVYYDGPVAEPRICGTGGGDPQGVGLAVVFVQGCPSVPAVTVAAHELIHSLGAVPDGAPHNCPPPNDHHTCDVTNDIMYPFADGSSLAALLLDPGRDDYYGHSGTWWDVQDSKWLVDLDRQVQLGLTVTGPGTVASDVPGLFCTATCTTTWNGGTQLTLTPTAAQGSRFLRWSGGCTGVAPCTLNLSQSASATAVFGPEAPSTFALTLSVFGRGSIRVNPLGVVCARRCSAPVPAFQRETLRAQPSAGWRFKGWTGSCHGKAVSCSVPMNAATSARASFVKAPVKKKK